MRNLQKFVLIIAFLNINFNLCYSQIQKCDNNQWKCKNGECIVNDELCDGHRNCSDGSDELAEECLHLKCPTYSFQCSYGACVAGSAQCNNITDCVDNSDEAPTLCNVNVATVNSL